MVLGATNRLTLPLSVCGAQEREHLMSPFYPLPGGLMGSILFDRAFWCLLSATAVASFDV